MRRCGSLPSCSAPSRRSSHSYRSSSRTWPAAIAFLPALAWIAVHLPRIAAFARPEVAWYWLMGAGDVWPLLGFVLGSQLLAGGIFLWVAAAMIGRWRSLSRAPVEPARA